MKTIRSALTLATTAALCTALTFGTSGVATASTPPIDNHDTTTAQHLSATPGVDATDVEEAFSLIESIPDEVLLAGDDALREWAQVHAVDPKNARASIIGCAGAIAFVIASTAFPAAKILKIKRLINSMGGVTQAARVFWGASFSYEKIRALGGAAAALGAELLGITQIRQQCFR